MHRLFGLPGAYVALIFGALGALPAAPADAACMSLISGSVVYDVAGCVQVEPERIFDLKKDKYSWIAGLDAAGRKHFFDSYRGLYVKGKVIKSKATSQGLTADDGALAGETLFMFIPPGKGTCNAVLSKRLAANLRQVCCDGSGDPPCLLDTSYVLTPQQIFATTVGDQTKNKAKHSKDYQSGDTALREHKFKIAARSYEKARANGELDIPGYYHLGLCYRELDQCTDAVPVLRHVLDEANKKQIWADDEADARKAIFLLARCQAKLNNPEAATQLLNAYLLEPQKYHDELTQALNHRDFGWIHTSREYLDFEKEARKKLAQVPAGTPAADHK